MLLALEISDEKWEQVLDDLRSDLKDSNAKFRMVFLIDDFVGTGSTLIRYDKQKSKWKGRLEKFWTNVDSKVRPILPMTGSSIFIITLLLTAQNEIYRPLSSEDELIPRPDRGSPR